MNQQPTTLADRLVVIAAILLSPPVITALNFLRWVCALGAIAAFAISWLGFGAALHATHGRPSGGTYAHLIGGMVLVFVLFVALGLLGVLPRIARALRSRY